MRDPGHSYAEALSPAFTYKRDKLYIEDICFEDILRRFPSPVIAYSRKRLADNLKSVKAAFNKPGRASGIKTSVFYSLKACYSKYVLKTFLDGGTGAEVMSIDEYRLAKKTGWPPGRIIWNGPGKSDEELALMAREGVGQINIDTESELAALDRIGRRSGKIIKIGVRIRPDHKGMASMFTARASRMGLDVKDGSAMKFCKIARSFNNVRLTGLHTHALIAKNDPDGHEDLACLLRIFAGRLYDELGIALEYINVGGGFGSRVDIETRGSGLYDFGKAVSKEIQKLFFRPLLILEIGRYLVNDAAVALTKIIRIKKNSGVVWLIVDIATNVLVPLTHTGFGAMPVMLKRRGAGRYKIYSIGDSLCSHAGVIQRDAVLPEVREGDHIAISNCGAYTVSMASTFGKPVPRVLFIDKNKVKAAGL